MRINSFIASASHLSRRAADQAIHSGHVTVNQQTASLGQDVTPTDEVRLDHKVLTLPETQTTILFHKPAGYIVSRDGQGNKTIYDILPTEYHSLKAVGRLDRDSSGLLVLTSDGKLAQNLTHPSFRKEKRYVVELDHSLNEDHKQQIKKGILIGDYISHLQLSGHGTKWQVTMFEGHNRQIRRTFWALGYTVQQLHRIQFGPYHIGQLQPSHWKEI